MFSFSFFFLSSFCATWQCPNNVRIVVTFTHSVSPVQGRRICIFTVTWSPRMYCKNWSDTAVVSSKSRFYSAVWPRLWILHAASLLCSENCGPFLAQTNVQGEVSGLKTLQLRFFSLLNPHTSFISENFHSITFLRCAFLKNHLISHLPVALLSPAPSIMLYLDIFRGSESCRIRMASVQRLASEVGSSLSHNCHTLVAPSSALYLDGGHMDQKDFLKWSLNGAEATPGM